MNFNSRLLCIAVAMGVMCVGLTKATFAQTASLSDIVRIYDPQLAPPAPFKDFTVPEQVPDIEPFLASFYGPIPGDNQWILFVEPEIPTTIPIDQAYLPQYNQYHSDRLSVRGGRLYFESDPLGQPFGDLPVVPIKTLVENGNFQQVDQYFQLFPGATIPRIDVLSDGNAPEPGTFALMAIGIAGGAFFVRRRA
jgi:hypothetical protein